MVDDVDAGVHCVRLAIHLALGTVLEALELRFGGMIASSVHGTARTIGGHVGVFVTRRVLLCAVGITEQVHYRHALG